jgi:hypothetical protein
MIMTWLTWISPSTVRAGFKSMFWFSESMYGYICVRLLTYFNS